jgi:hypothetical protein
MTEWRLVATARGRGASRLSRVVLDPPPDPEIAALLTLARTIQNGAGASPLFVTGGEPTLRGDLPELIGALASAGHAVCLACDGLALAAEGAAEPLILAGLGRVRVTLHAARADAHDWLVGQAGAAKRVVRAIGRLKALGAAVEIQATVTRPTMPVVSELVELAASLGVERVLFERVIPPSADDLVVLTPRLGLLEPYLVNAVVTGIEKKVAIELHGFPECAARRAKKSIAPTDAVKWLVPAGLSRPEPAPTVPGCPSCPGLPRCVGAPRDYVERFGATEFRSEQPNERGGVLVVPEGMATVQPPPARSGRAPVTRVDSVRTLVGRDVSGDPLADKLPRATPNVIRFRFPAPARIACEICSDGVTEHTESTRNVRLRMVRAAQEGARGFRIASTGSLAHPAAAALLREATLLSYDRVEVAGEASALREASDAELYALKGITRFDVALYGPDAKSHDAHVGRAGAFEAALAVAARVKKLALADVGSYAVIHDAGAVQAYARTWAQNELPGEPCFRLSPAGDSLEELAAAASALPEGPARGALTRVLPACLLGRSEPVPALEPGTEFTEALDPATPPSASDRCGTFRPCVCGGELAPRCPGIATGWKTALLP